MLTRVAELDDFLLSLWKGLPTNICPYLSDIKQREYTKSEALSPFLMQLLFLVCVYHHLLIILTPRALTILIAYFRRLEHNHKFSPLITQQHNNIMLIVIRLSQIESQCGSIGGFIPNFPITKFPEHSRLARTHKTPLI
jgi:hypothetical protein